MLCGCEDAFKLLFHDLQHFHGTCLDTNTTGNTFGGGTLCRSNHNLHGASLNALAAGGTQLLIDHIYTGLGVLGNGTYLTDLGALAALNAGHRLGATALGNDLNAGKIRIKGLIKGNRAGTDAL